MATLTRSNVSFFSSEVKYEHVKTELEQNERNPEGNAWKRNDLCTEA